MTPAGLQDFKGADWELLEIHVVPTEPGHVRLLVRILMAGHKLPLLPRMLCKLLPVWASHLRGMDITDGDTVLLNQQARHSLCSAQDDTSLLMVSTL